MSCIVVRHPAAPSLIGFVILRKKKDSKREMKYISPVNYGTSSEYDKFSSYSESPTHKLCLNYAYVTADLCIRYG
ncbi:hypothetical protein Bca101_031923 [Brassica carinata]